MKSVRAATAGNDIGKVVPMRREQASWPRKVLFVCTSNSARTVLAEAILNKFGYGRFVAYSGGSQPKGVVHPEAIALLHRLGFATEGLHSKSWIEFAMPGAPPLDFVFIVCDNAESEVCPIWPGAPITSHWGVPDPGAVRGSGTAIASAFRDAFLTLQHRIELFTNLPLDNLDRASLKARLDEIGRAETWTVRA